MSKTRITVIVLSAAVITLSYMGWMSREVWPLTSREVVSFELAGTVARANELIQGLGREKVTLMEKSLYLDFGFLFCYVSSIAVACRLLPTLTGRSRWITAGRYLSYFSVLAGILDALENILLLRFLNTNHPSFEPVLAAACASGKFLIVAVALLYVLITAGMLVKIKKPD